MSAFPPPAPPNCPGHHLSVKSTQTTIVTKPASTPKQDQQSHDKLHGLMRHDRTDSVQPLEYPADNAPSPALQPTSDPPVPPAPELILSEPGAGGAEEYYYFAALGLLQCTAQV
ncbi:hypothetical protein NPIL_623021 [Nephila pilipes]|uniref:Uncharacterized protein n=1 Tax=Nephila pilipes TaxID=299642 RepID=A0A8X6T669_NEPPI|nr:hypothetical protein NPIL_623021 [Nephila pilipes]